MNQELFEINTLEVLSHFFISLIGEDFHAKKMKLHNPDAHHKFDTAIYIGVYGNIEGMLLIETKTVTAENFAKAISSISGMEIDLNELIKSYVGEMGNVLLTKTFKLINKNFGDSHLSTPSVFVGSGIQVNLFYKKSWTVVLGTQFGDFKITFAIKE
jgi:CheY-specific phosphatase CheX